MLEAREKERKLVELRKATAKKKRDYAHHQRAMQRAEEARERANHAEEAKMKTSRGPHRSALLAQARTAGMSPKKEEKRHDYVRDSLLSANHDG